MSNLETIYNGIMDENTAKRNALIAERDEFEKKWLKRTKEFFEKIKFLNDKGFGLYISVKDKKGWSPYPNAKSILIRSKRTHGWISVWEDGTIVNDGCCGVDTCLGGKQYRTIEEFIEDIAKANYR